MTQEEWEILKKIINRNVNSGELDDLKKLKLYLQRKINGEKVTLTLENTNILLMRIDEFIATNFSSETRVWLKPYNLAIAVGRIKGLKTISVRMYHLFGISEKTYSKNNYRGKKTIDTIEAKLNEYGLSLSQSLSHDQIRKLNEMALEGNNRLISGHLYH